MTKNYYNKNADLFIQGTINLDMSRIYHVFEKYLHKNAKILDLGFGAGRDSNYFYNKGYDVVSTDISEEFVKKGKKFLKNEVLLMDTLEMNFENEFDAIWACASLLHFNDEELNIAFKNCFNALKSDGIMYTSFKRGSFAGERHGRFFHDFELDDLIEVIKNNGFDILENYIGEDIRPDRTEQWINIFFRKTN